MHLISRKLSIHIYKDILGHWPASQVMLSWLFPGHPPKPEVPPIHVLVLVLVPVPQVTLHAP